uniref:SWIM-type domain-containing protein n=1 Tax=Lactuca sativa TaxID=4236 RepID=A0A9R1VNA5_LACSA|nr:hypothetical protein LSAT_V11C400161400 [Lactuca sativa]
MFVRQTYDNEQQLIFSLGLKATREKFQFTTKHSNKNCYEEYCEIENCSWRLYAKRLDPTDEFEIGTFNNSLHIHPNHKHANKKVMGPILHEIMRKTRSKVWRPNEILRDLNALMEINVDYKQAWRAKQYAMELLLGSSEECFSKLPIYFHNSKRRNPGMVAYIQTDPEDYFECCFYVIGSTIRAFKRFCRKVIIMDGAHSKGNHIACSSYGWEQPDTSPCTQNMKKSGLTWIWFLEKLYECVGDCQELTFVTDRADVIREWCNKRRIEGGKPSTVLTEWAKKVVSKNEEHTTRWSVSGVSDAIYQVHDFKHGGIVDMRQETCTCKYWEGTGLPCGHVIMVLKHLKKTNFGHQALDAYTMERYRSTYEEPV